ncbi:MAG: methyl-accepting chemotaxis protein [Candidatus Endobugula sp.]|jgi:methyl-accepting chemotaxis protein
MKESRVSIFTQIKSNKKVIFLVFVIVAALGVMLYNSYRLLNNTDEAPGAKEQALITSLQAQFTTLPSFVVALASEGDVASNRIRDVQREISTNWKELEAFTYLSEEVIAGVDSAIQESFDYVGLALAGSEINQQNISKLTIPFFRLQAVRDEVNLKARQPKNNIRVQAIVAAVGIIALTLIIMATVLWVDAFKVLKVADEENLAHQSAILRLLDELAGLADGDLTVTTTVSEDFTGAIADSVNYTIDQLRQLVSRINTTAVQVSSAAQDSQQTAFHLAEASDHQAQEIAGASAAINEMAVTIDQVSANAAESAIVASRSVSIAHNGSKMVQNTIHGMDTIREQIQDTSKRIKRLGESTQEIGDIVSLINDIADQTNILALNAAIQASMAGDAGRGFAVVADEVQRLAERSACATKQIGSLVKTIQTDTNEAVKSMEQTTTEVVSGARLAQDAGVALEEIEGVSANLAELIQNISNAARQQASSAGHISNTMNVIQEITSQTSAGTGATAHAIGDLADMALELREFVAGFKLPDEMNTAISLEGEQEHTNEIAQPPVLNRLSSPQAKRSVASAPIAGIDREPSYRSETPNKAMFYAASDDEMDNDFSHLFEGEYAGDFDAAAEDNKQSSSAPFDQLPPILDASDAVSSEDTIYDMSDDDMLMFVDSEDADGLEEEFDLDDLDFIDEKPTSHS